MTKSFNLSDHMPKDPMLQRAWVDCLRWAISDPDVLARFTAETGNEIDPNTTPIGRLVAASSGVDRALFESFIHWFGKSVWGGAQ